MTSVDSSVLIGAHASVASIPLLTRDPVRVRTYTFPSFN